MSADAPAHNVPPWFGAAALHSIQIEFARLSALI
jgi:hypothetical protein